MKSKWFERRPLIIAHRGASAYAPENTMAAFKTALEMGADGIEFDVALTRDNEVVVIHDETVQRTTNGIGKVCEFTLEELQLLDAGKYFDKQFSGERIPALETVFEVFGKKLLINVEIKNFQSPFDKLPVKVARMVTQFGLEEHVIISSFNPVALIKAGKQSRDIPLAILTFGSIPSPVRFGIEKVIRHHAIHPHGGLVSKKWLVNRQSKGCRINVWTVNRPEEIREFVDIGVDGIITDCPDLAREVIDMPVVL